MYEKANATHLIEALVVAGFEPITTPAPTTTTVKPNTTTTIKPNTTTKTTTTSKPVTTSLKPKVTVAPTHASSSNTVHRRRREENVTNVAHGVNNIQKINSTRIPVDVTFPYVCQNKTAVMPDPKKVYGYFSKKMTVKGKFTDCFGTNIY